MDKMVDSQLSSSPLSSIGLESENSDSNSTISKEIEGSSSPKKSLDDFFKEAIQKENSLFPIPPYYECYYHLSIEQKSYISQLVTLFNDFRLGRSAGRSYLRRFEVLTEKSKLGEGYLTSLFDFLKILCDVDPKIDTTGLIVLAIFQPKLFLSQANFDPVKDFSQNVSNLIKEMAYFSKKLFSEPILSAQTKKLGSDIINKTHLKTSSLLAWMNCFRLVTTVGYAFNTKSLLTFLALVSFNLDKMEEKTFEDTIAMEFYSYCDKSIFTNGSHLDFDGYLNSDDEGPVKKKSKRPKKEIEPQPSREKKVPEKPFIYHIDASKLNIDKKGFHIIQESACQLSKYIGFNRCKSCIAKQTDVCRFKFSRVFALEKGTLRLVNGNKFIKAKDYDDFKLDIPKNLRSYIAPKKKDPSKLPHIPDFVKNISLAQPFNYPEFLITEDHNNVMQWVAQPLLNALQLEVNYIDQVGGDLHYRKQIGPIGHNCDMCRTGIFGGFWMCACCGREACLACFKNWDRELELRKNFQLSCSFRRQHGKDIFIPCSNYLPSTIKALHQAVSEFLSTNKSPVLSISEDLLVQPNPNHLPYAYAKVEDFSLKDFKACIGLGMPMVMKMGFDKCKYSCDPSHLIGLYGKEWVEVLDLANEIPKESTVGQFFRRFLDNALQDELASKSESEVNIVNTAKPKLAYANKESNKQVAEIQEGPALEHANSYPNVGKECPEQFPGKTESEESTLNGSLGQLYLSTKARVSNHSSVEAESNNPSLDFNKANKEQTVPIKIKDWPSDCCFADYFPHLFRDFMNLLPFPEYMHYNGSMNLISRLPKSHITPDLGPKMYNAYPSAPDSMHGTTRLHLDAADAINIMFYSSGQPDEAGAVWDLFRREDADLIREYIQSTEKGILGDPIHDQFYYLNDNSLKELELKGVKSIRVYQKPGECVVIPAGCAHQVLNLKYCIKTAMDFVAPESAKTCYDLTQQFRMLPSLHQRNVDIVGSVTLMATAFDHSHSAALGVEPILKLSDVVLQPGFTKISPYLKDYLKAYKIISPDDSTEASKPPVSKRKRARKS